MKLNLTKEWLKKKIEEEGDYEIGAGYSVLPHILAALLLNSFRYCLRRSTYAVFECVEHLTLYWNVLPKEWQEQIHRDVKKAISGNRAGMDMDVEQWQKILELRVKGE